MTKLLDKQNLIICGFHSFTLRDESGIIKERHVYKNLIVDATLTEMCKRLANSPTVSGVLTHGALGTSATVVAVGDIKLGTESYRKTFATRTQVGNTVECSVFFNPNEVSGTFYEYGTFLDGGATADSGILFSHLNISIIKPSSQSLTADSVYTLSTA